MALIEILKPKQLALYTTIILGASFFTIGCDNAKTPTVVEKPAEMSQQQLADFIKSSLNNFINKYNVIQNFATLSLDSFTADADKPQMIAALSIALTDLDQYGTPIIIHINYLITPEQTLQNNSYTVAKFVLQSINFDDTTLTSDKNSFATFVQQLVDDSGLSNNGYITATGDIWSDVKSNKTFTYVNDNTEDGLNAATILPFGSHYQTKDNMALMDVNFDAPSLSIQFDAISASLKNVKIQGLNHTFDEKFDYTGQNSYHIDTIEINYADSQVLINDFILNSESTVSENGLVKQDIHSSFAGIFPNAIGKQTKFSASGHMQVDNLNMAASQQWNQYVTSPSFTYDDSESEKIKLLSNLFKEGFSFAITDTDIEFDGVKGTFNVTFDVAPTDIPNTIKPHTFLVQMVNNVSIGVNSVIPVEWFTILGLDMNRASLDNIIKQTIQQIDMMGYNGAITYDGKQITAHFDIKKGNVFVNGDLKGSVFNTLAAFM